MKDFGQSATTVSFICLKLFLSYPCSGILLVAVSFCTFDLVDMLLAEGDCAKGLIIRRLFVASFAGFAAECCSFILFFLAVCLFECFSSEPELL